MPVCDGCGAETDDAHIRARIARLEMATRYRPVHLQVLLIDAAPPVRLEDYLYNAASDRNVRSVGSRMYFDELVKGIGLTSDAAVLEEAALSEFQRRGFFLASACECPVSAPMQLEDVVSQSVPTLFQRIRTSYKPKRIVFLSSATHGVIRLIQDSDLKDRLILDNGEPFFDPFLADPPAQAEFATAFGDRLAKAISRSI